MFGGATPHAVGIAEGLCLPAALGLDRAGPAERQRNELSCPAAHAAFLLRREEQVGIDVAAGGLFLPRPHVRQRRWGRVRRTPHDVTFLGCAPHDRGTVPYLFTASCLLKRCGIDSISVWAAVWAAVWPMVWA